MNLLNQILRSKKGSAIVLVVVGLVILLILGGAILALGFQARVRSIRVSRQLAAKEAADAGVHKALYKMNQKLGGGWNTTMPYETDQPLDNANQSYSYQVHDTNGYFIESVGKSEEQERSVRAYLRLAGPYDYAIVVKDLLNIGKTEIFGYDSRISIDPDAQELITAEVGTLSTESERILFHQNTNINGNVFVGVGGEPSAVMKDYDKRRDAVRGTFYSLENEITFSSSTAPNLNDKGSLTVNGTHVISDSGKYTDITFDSNSILEINGDVQLHVTGDVLSKNNNKIIVNDGGSLELFFDGDIRPESGGGSNGIEINNKTKVPANLQLKASGSGEQLVYINNNLDFYGLIDAPDVYVDFNNNNDFYGAVIADSFEMKNNGVFYYDIALRDLYLPTQEDVYFAVDYWEE